MSIDHLIHDRTPVVEERLNALREQGTLATERSGNADRARYLLQHAPMLYSQEERTELEKLVASDSTNWTLLTVPPEKIHAAAEKGYAQARSEIEARLAELDDLDHAKQEYYARQQNKADATGNSLTARALRLSQRFEDPTLTYQQRLAVRAERTQMAEELGVIPEVKWSQTR